MQFKYGDLVSFQSPPMKSTPRILGIVKDVSFDGDNCCPTISWFGAELPSVIRYDPSVDAYLLRYVTNLSTRDDNEV